MPRRWWWLGLVVLAGPLGAQGRFAVVREALERGDSTEALEVLRRQGDLAPSRPAPTALTALLTLQWMGRSASYARSAERHWNRQLPIVSKHVGDTWDAAGRAGREVSGSVELPEAWSLYLIAHHLVFDRRPVEDPLRQFLSIGDLWGYVELVAADTSRDPDIRTAAAWVLAQRQVAVFDSVLSEALPLVQVLPMACVRSSPESECVVRADAGADTSMRVSFAPESPFRRLDVEVAYSEVRDALMRVAAGSWPLSELAASTLVAIEALRPSDGRRTSLDAFDMVPMTRSRLAAVAAEFAGRRDDAAAEMLAHGDWYAPLDRETRLLTSTRLDQAVFWRTAWPFFLEPYNARLVAHRSRLLLADLMGRVDPDRGGIGALVERDRLVRRGLPVSVSRRIERTDTVVKQGARFVEHTYRAIEYIDNRLHETTIRTTTREQDAPRLDVGLAAARDPRATLSPSGYVPQSVNVMDALQHQVVQVQRDGRTLVEFWATRPALCRERRPVMGFFLLDDRLGLIRRVIDSTSVATERYRLLLDIAPGTYVYSMEVMDRACRVGARARYVLSVRDVGREGISDMMLADSLKMRDPRRVTGERPMDTRADWSVRASEPVHLYWELYDVPADATALDRLEVVVQLRNVRRTRVAVRDLRNVERAASRMRPNLDLEYSAPAPAGREPLGMALSIGLPPDAQGVHVVRVEIRDRVTGRQWAAERAFYVER